MKGKKSFVIYCDLLHTVEKVSDEQAGALFKHMLRYVNDQNPETDDVMTQVLFEPVRQTLKRDLVKWKTLQERNAKNGAKGGRPKKEPKETQNNPVGLSKTQANPEKGDSVSARDSASVTVTETDTTEVTKVTTAKAVTDEAPEKVTYGNPEINKILNFIKTGFALTDFKEPQKQQRQYARHLLNLGKKLGLEEFQRRFSVLVDDDFKSKNCNSIKYLYRELKSVPAADSVLNKDQNSKIDVL